MSFLEEVHTELTNLWKSLENKGDNFAQLFKGVVDKVGEQVQTEAKDVAPAVEADAKADATEAAADVEQAATGAAPAAPEAPATEEAPAAPEAAESAAE
jgi:flagellar hook-basal body complex protein FliE